MSAKKFSGTQKAAMILMALGEDVASDIFKNMSQSEVRRIASTLSQMERIDQNLVEDVLEEFNEKLNAPVRHLRGNKEYVDRLLSRSFSQEDAHRIKEEIGINSPLTETLNQMTEIHIASIITKEHPQTAALILAHLEPDRFASVIKHLPEGLRPELVERVAMLDQVDPESLVQLNEVLREQLQKSAAGNLHKIGGMQAVANMLATMDRQTESKLIDDLAQTNPDLAENIKQMMFTFDDLSRLDIRAMQGLLQKVPKQQLVLALKGEPGPVADAIFAGMSSRAAALLKEDILSSAKVPLREVEAARQEIAQLALKLSEEGKIQILDQNEVYV